MEEVLAYLAENIWTIILGICVIVANLLGKTKTAEQLEEKFQKQVNKKEKKFNKTVAKAKKLSQEIDEMKEKHNNA